MKTSAWRIVKYRFARRAFDGTGAQHFGGRWNSPGLAAVYTAGSVALAAMELLIQLQDQEILRSYRVIEATFDSAMIESVDPSSLPQRWTSSDAVVETRRIGDLWLKEQRTPVLQIPSAVIPIESNYILNPQHSEFRSIMIGKPLKFEFDRRLIGKRRR